MSDSLRHLLFFLLHVFCGGDLRLTVGLPGVGVVCRRGTRSWGV